MNHTILFALCGSFCTFEKVIPQIKKLVEQGNRVIPIMSYYASKTDTRFGKAQDIKEEIEKITGNKIIDTIEGAEPIGPKRMGEILVVAPCTGNTLAKLANNIIDTPVTMAVKSHLRSNQPVVIGLSTNDGLTGSAANLGILLNRRHYYFVPFSQDDHLRKPASLQADFEQLPDTIESALRHKQIQPIVY
ncbi:MAG: dipicolinate synthase subunit B [Oscillospiraceae bacterium]|nr:dipicolinate synthase subunit B [Oscillospiraceae bacterium]